MRPKMIHRDCLLGIALMCLLGSIFWPTVELQESRACAATPSATLALAATSVAQDADVAPADPVPMKFRKGLTRKERREMGLTFRNVRKTLAGLQESGEVTEDMTTSEVSLIVANHLLDSNPQAFQDPEFDFDAFLDFLERLLELFMKWFALFS